MPEHPRHDEDESGLGRDLPGALRAASDAFPAPSSDLVGRGHTRGRRLRRNRRIGIGIAGTALAAVALSGTYVVAGLGDDTKQQTASGPTTVASTPSATGQSAAAAPTVTAEQMTATLKSLLPQGGTFTDEYGRGTEPTGPKPATGAAASVVYRDGKGGATGVGVSIGRSGDADDCPPRQVRPYADCTPTQLPGGSRLVTTKGFTYPSSNQGQKMWSAELIRPDGLSVAVTAYGGGGEKDTTSSVDPLLAIEQVQGIATSPAWAPALVAVAAASPPAPQTPPAQGPAGAEIMALLETFLPRGATTSDKSAQAGYASLIADDGKGESAIGINVQRKMTDALAPVFSCEKIGAEALSCTTETLPDGSTLLLVKQRSEKGGNAQRWSADLLRPDGFRVVVSSINSYAEAAAPTRTAPLLNLDQLKEIATDPRWATL